MAEQKPAETAKAERDPVTGLLLGEDDRNRCWWHGGLEDYQRYHDTEWGWPVDEDRRLFEKICLEGFQSGLSWLTILRKREAFRAAFANFEFERVAEFTEADVERCLQDSGIVRHRRKIESTINNARRALELRQEFGTLAAYFWSFEPKRKTGLRRWTSPRQRPWARRPKAPSSPRISRNAAGALSARPPSMLHAIHGHGQRPPGRLLLPRRGGSKARSSDTACESVRANCPGRPA